jgi:hypothetical protein
LLLLKGRTKKKKGPWPLFFSVSLFVLFTYSFLFSFIVYSFPFLVLLNSFFSAISKTLHRTHGGLTHLRMKRNA